MSFDDIPENEEYSCPCPQGSCKGSVKEIMPHHWECDTCNFKTTEAGYH